MSVTLDMLHKLFLESDTEKLFSSCRSYMNENPDDPKAKAYAAFARCGEILRTYKKDAEELLFSVNKKAERAFFSKLFIGKNEFYTNPVHDKYFSDIETAVDSLRDALKDLPEEDTLRSELAESFTRMLLVPATKEQKDMRFLFSADDTFASRLIPLIKKEGLKSLREEYLRAYPKKRDRLPNQENLLKELQESISE